LSDALPVFSRFDRTLRPIPPSEAPVRRHLSSTWIAAFRRFFQGSEDRDMPWWFSGSMVFTIGTFCALWHYSHVPDLLVSRRVLVDDLNGTMGRHQANDTPLPSITHKGAALRLKKTNTCHVLC